MTLVVAGIFAVAPVVAQEQIGGPYEPDSATVLLLHFDDDLTNASDLAADGIGNGNLQFITDNRLAELGLGKQLYINNGSRSDSSYVVIPDTAALDLEGSWTMEFWVNVFTYGDTNEDWRWQPRIMFKPGENRYYQSNYFITMWGGPQAFKTGYYSASGAGHTEIQSPTNSVNPGEWYHITYIRDTTRNVIVQLLHNVDRELIHFESLPFDPIRAAPPLVNDNPLYIGMYPFRDITSLDGFIDEIRISNVVRNFAIPPIINAAQLTNQLADEAVEVEASVGVIGGADVETTTLHYRVNGGSWQEAAMSHRDGETFATTLPGQDLGSVVEYYISAETDTGLRSTLPAGAEDEIPSLFSYAVWQPNTQTLHLSFDDDADLQPADKSGYNNQIIVHGEPEYVPSDLPGSDMALRFDGTFDHLEIAAPAPFVNGTEFTVDFWFNADTIMASQTRFVIKEGGSSFNEFNYQIWTNGSGRVIPAAYVPGQTNSGSRTGSLTRFNEARYEPGQWYRVVYVTTSDSTYARFYNADNELIDENGGAITGTVHLGDGPLRIGAHSPGASVDEDGVPNGPLFKGMMDEIKIFNYVPAEYVAVSNEEWAELPAQIQLDQNYPNPFNPTTTIKYALPAADKVTLKVYDVLGRQVMTLVDGLVPAGTHQVQFNAGELASGIYFYQLKSEGTMKVRKMLLVK